MAPGHPQPPWWRRRPEHIRKISEKYKFWYCTVQPQNSTHPKFPTAISANIMFTGLNNHRGGLPHTAKLPRIDISEFTCLYVSRYSNEQFWNWAEIFTWTSLLNTKKSQPELPGNMAMNIIDFKAGFIKAKSHQQVHRIGRLQQMNVQHAKTHHITTTRSNLKPTAPEKQLLSTHH